MKLRYFKFTDWCSGFSTLFVTVAVFLFQDRGADSTALCGGVRHVGQMHQAAVAIHVGSLGNNRVVVLLGAGHKLGVDAWRYPQHGTESFHEVYFVCQTR